LNLISFVPPENKLLANFSITLLKAARAKDILTFTSLKETIINYIIAEIVWQNQRLFEK
jgi:hypothetical protein